MHLGEGKTREAQGHSKDSNLGDWPAGNGNARRLGLTFENLELDASAGHAIGGSQVI